MPEYTFEDTVTGEVIDVVLSLSEREQYLKDNPTKIQIIKPVGFIPGVGMKPDDGFRDILREIKKANKGSTIETF